MAAADCSEDDVRKYRAPALEKGLDVLELLASHGVPLTTSQMATLLGRSVSELFRMVLALEYRGYIALAEGREGYELTNKLFALGMAQTANRTLLDAALPIMNDLRDRKSTRLNSSHVAISYAGFCLKKKNK